jgi:hypothetical protein
MPLLDLGPFPVYTTPQSSERQSRRALRPILALHLDTRYLAYVLFQHGAPSVYEIVRLRRRHDTPKDAIRRASSTLLDLLHAYLPAVVVRNKPASTLAKSSSVLCNLIRGIDELAQARTTPLLSYSLADVWRRFRPLCRYLEAAYFNWFPLPTARLPRIALAVSVLFPQLSRFAKPSHLARNTHFREIYYRRLFFAVALGVTHHIRTHRSLDLGSPHEDLIERVLAGWRN